jgi:hypothetical protein
MNNEFQLLSNCRPSVCSCFSVRSEPEHVLPSSDVYARYIDSFISDMKKVYRVNGWPYHGISWPDSERQHLGKLNEGP